MGDPNDPIWNCVSLACCGDAEATKALAEWIQHDLGPADPSIPDWPVTQDQAQMVAAWILKRFDLVEKGALKPLREFYIRVYQAQA